MTDRKQSSPDEVAVVVVEAMEAMDENCLLTGSDSIPWSDCWVLLVDDSGR